MSPEATKILDRYRRLCSMREYCASDVLGKVRKALTTARANDAGPDAPQRRSRRRPACEADAREQEQTLEEFLAQIPAGGTIDARTANRLLNPDDVPEVKKSAADRNEIEKTAQEILQSLIDDKYVDDRRYAEAFCRDKSALAGWGRVKIRYMLRAKGISDEIIREALEEIDPGRADQRLQKLAEAKFKMLAEDPQCKIKLLRYLLGRGYQYEDVAPVVNALMAGRPATADTDLD